MVAADGGPAAAPPLTTASLLKRCGICVVSESSFQIALLVELALLAAAVDDGAVAAYSAALNTFTYAIGIFNFLLVVTMSQVGRTVGTKQYALLGYRIGMAFATALCCAVLTGGLLAALRHPVLSLMGLGDDDASGSGGDANNTATATATTALGGGEDAMSLGERVFLIRLGTLPGTFVYRVCTGVLNGYQRVTVAAVLAVFYSVMEVVGVYLAVHGVFHDGPAATQSADSKLEAATWASVVAVSATAVLGVLAVVRFPLREARGAIRIRLFPPREVTMIVAEGHGRLSAAAPRLPPPTPLGFVEMAKAYLASSGNMAVRSILLSSSVWLLSVASGRLHRLPAHQVLIQLWMATSYVCDGFADAGTTVGSKLLGEQRYAECKRVANRLVCYGGVVGILSGLVMWFGKAWLVATLTPADDADKSGTRAALDHAWPLLCLLQPCNALVFVYDGIIYATNDYRFVRNLMLLGFFGLFTPVLAGSYFGAHAFLGVWAAKACLNAWRCVGAVWLIEWSMRGVWRRPTLPAAADAESAARVPAEGTRLLGDDNAHATSS